LEHGVETINAQGLTVGGDVYKMKLSFYDNRYIPPELVANDYVRKAYLGV
jgi:hypothetical protein